MTDIVSFETAKRLQEAGFPQPVPEFGQMWYCGNQQLYTRIRAKPYMDGKRRFYGDNGCMIFERPENMVFAPTATDILPPDCYLCREISYKTASGERWVVYDWETRRLVCPVGIETDNPAEACAEAWLELSKA
jgi:hypothetical protein